jgi:hypothetical protein
MRRSRLPSWLLIYPHPDPFGHPASLDAAMSPRRDPTAADAAPRAQPGSARG